MSIEDASGLGEKKDRSMSVKRIKRRIERIGAMTDTKRANKARQRLSNAVLAAIAEGKVRDPRKIAAMVVSIGQGVRG